MPAVALAWLLAMVPGVPPAAAGTTVKDVLVAVRTIGFVVNPPTGAVELAVVFDPGRPDSVDEMKTALAALADGTRVGGATVHPVPLAVTELSPLKAFRFVLLTGGVSGYFQTVFDQTRGRGVLTMSTDLACVRAGQCVMGVAAEPRVQVLVNRAASQAAAVEFAVSFRMMITEL